MPSPKAAVLRYISAVIIAVLTVSNPAVLRAASSVTFIPGLAVVDAAMQDSLTATLQSSSADNNGAQFFAITAVQGTGAWALVSIAGFTQVISESWSLESAAWIGLAIAAHNADGTWSSALKEQPAFTALLARVPDSDLDASARAGLSLSRRPLVVDQTIYRFPWQLGTSMYYGFLGVHSGGYPSLGTYKAVDFLSDGNTSLGHAPNRLLAAASGTIDYVCNDLSNNLNVAIRIGNVLYLHLLPNNPNLVVGHHFEQGEYIGQLKTGSFSDRCGYASQADNWFHVHWAFPDTTNTTGTFQSGGWTLTLADQIWRRDNAIVMTQTWMLADYPYRTYVPFISTEDITPVARNPR